MGHPSAPKPWLNLYGTRPKHVVADFSDMLSIFRATVEHSKLADSIRYRGGALSYESLDESSDALAAWLDDEATVTRGSRIAIILQNVPEFAVAVVAAWKLGAVPMPLNPMYQERELALLFADGLPAVIICHDNNAQIVSTALNNSGIKVAAILTCSQDEMNALREASPKTSSAAENGTCRLSSALTAKPIVRKLSISLRATDAGLLLYTSGTTGTPKGAVLSHGALAFNSRISVDWFGVRPAARILAVAPLFHITGFMCQLCVAFLSRGAILLNYRFDAGATLESMYTHQPTFMIATITAYIALMNHPAAEPAHFLSFDTLYAGGGPVPLAMVRQFQSRFGRRIAIAYGMTETCAPTHVVPYEHDTPVDEASGTLSVGIPVSDADAMIEHLDGTPALVGEAGELLIRGPMLMDGYLNKPEATDEALKDGWMHTGDVAVMDPRGWFYLIDRKKDMIIASGFKVWPREIEDVLYGHPSVREVAVVGVPDSYRGETIRAYISLRPGMDVTAQELMIQCRAQLAAYKVPRQIEFMPELPKTTSGKIMRSELRKITASYNS